jgi:hypothetical protein
MDSDPQALSAVDRTVAAATEVLRMHRPDTDGWCLACLAAWGRLVFIEQCTLVQWAAAVHAKYVPRRPEDPPAPGY